MNVTPASLSPGATIGPYVVEEPLGAGGMGQVWRAHDRSLLRPVALKVLSPEAEADPSLRARFVREARAAAALVHPNVVTIYGAGEEDGRTYLAMELVVGRTFRLASPGATTLQRLAWLLEVARALAAVHRAGFVHRDVKPDNVMITPQGSAKLLDFGIARAPHVPTDGPPSIGRTSTGEILGTPRYIAPEQWRAASVDGRADQFAWGVMAYEALSGRHPDDASAGFGRVSDWRAPAAPLHLLAPDLPFGVSALVGRAIAPFPEQRFPSMDDVVRELEGCVASAAPRPTPAGGDTRPDLPPQPLVSATKARSRPTSTALVFVGALLAVPLLALAALLVVFLARPRAATPVPPVASAASSGATPDPSGAASVVAPSLAADAGASAPPTPSAPRPAPPPAEPGPKGLCARYTSATVAAENVWPFPYDADRGAWERAIARPILACLRRAPDKYCGGRTMTIGVEIEESSGTLLGFIHSVTPETGSVETDENLSHCLARAITTSAPRPTNQPRYSGTVRVSLAP